MRQAVPMKISYCSVSDLDIEALKVLYHRRGCKICFKSQLILRPLLERYYMHGSISIGNISFSGNCDTKTTKCKERHGRLFLGKVYF